MWYDLVILGILILATIHGAVRGFVWQLAGIAGVVLCFAFSGTLSPWLAPYIQVDPPLNRWIAMLILYLAFSFAAFVVARQIRGWLERVRLVEYDRHLGAVFGFVKGAAFALVLTFFLVTLSQRARSQIFTSMSGQVAAVVMDRLHPVMPVELHDVLEPYIHRLDRPGLDLRHSPQSRHSNRRSPDARHRRFGAGTSGQWS